jgi:hydroxymethylpyrimidine pyrophosphatase-like HAD family hydrolase
MGGLILSDVDGTLVHYDRLDGGGGDAVLPLPPSSTGLRGHISLATLQHIQRLRKQGHTFVLVSGMRASTFWQRLPCLPLCDGYAIENGGRLFWNDPGRGTAACLAEDLGWAAHHAAASPPGQEGVSPSLRTGLLWDRYRLLVAAGYTCDAAGYSTQFRIKTEGEGPEAEQRLRQLLADLPPELNSAFNLGCADVFATTSGKANVASYVAARFDLQIGINRVVFLCDDDNDVDLAQRVAKAFVVGVNSQSMADAIRTATRPGQFVVPPAGVTGTAATEAMLAAVEAHLNSS